MEKIFHSVLKKSSNSRRGFTLLELLVTISILAILVLLAIPRFSGMIEEARTARITNDIKVVEGKVGEHLILKSLDDWEGPLDLSGIEILYNKKGKINESTNISQPGIYRSVPKEILKNAGTSLKGNFYSNKDGLVYYSEELASGGNFTNEEISELVNNNNFIPVANSIELAQINGSSKDEDGNPIYEELTWGAGTPWETKKTGTLASKYIQVADIDLQGLDWQPIGNGATPFSGVFNGGKFTISNLTISESNSNNYLGLFARIESSVSEVEFSNIILDSANIAGSGYYSGVLAAFVNSESDGEINIENVNIISAVNSSSSSYAGGLIGLNVGNIKGIKNTNVDLDAGMGEKGSVAGLVGYSVGRIGNIKNVSINAELASKESNAYTHAAGLVGFYIGSHPGGLAIEDISVDGYFNSEKTAGLISFNDGQLNSIENVTVKGEIISNDFAGGLIGQHSTQKGQLKDIKNIKIIAKIESKNASGGLIASNHSTGINGVGHINDILIQSDIISDGHSGGLIGISSGNVRKIENISIQSSTVTSEGQNAGGIIAIYSAYADDSLEINEVEINESSIIGRMNVGGLLGSRLSNNINLNNINIVSTIESKNASAGGLIGANHPGEKLTEISNIKAEGDIKGYSEVGGLIGISTSLVTISNTNLDINLSDLASSTGAHIGGLIGKNASSISTSVDNSTIAGSITGGQNVGGLYGANYSGSGDYTKPVIKNVHVDVEYTDGLYIGSLAGFHVNVNYSAILNSSFKGSIQTDKAEAYTGGLYGQAYEGYSSSAPEELKAMVIKDTEIEISQSNTSSSGNSGGLFGFLYGTFETDTSNFNVKSEISGAATKGTLIGTLSLPSPIVHDYEDMFSEVNLEVTGPTQKFGLIEIDN